jgi:fatty-acid desaturase
MTAKQGTAKNVWWLIVLHLNQGDNWHSNHHRKQNSPRLGYGAAQVDIGWWVIRLLGWCGVASRFKSTGIEQAAVTENLAALQVAVPGLRSRRSLWRFK